MSFDRHDLNDLIEEQMAHELRLGLTSEQVAERYGKSVLLVDRIREEQLIAESDNQAVQYE